jgi:mono/diheme cytochrome c family protein
MKKTFRVLVIMIALGTIQSCASRRSEPIKQKEFTYHNERVASGERMFMSYCQKCHPAGEGGLGPSINANPAAQFIKRFQMRHGLGVMPSFKKDEISKQSLRDISKFLRAWKSY